jgi:hypothetical protein
MKIVDGSWSLVIVGKWNRYILTPTWVAKNLFEHEEIGVEYPINNLDLPVRFRSPDNIVFVPAVHRITFLAQDPYGDDMLRKICIMAHKLVDILAHTPITAMGINCIFEEKAEDFEALSMFDFFDSQKITDSNYEVHSSEIKRQLNRNGTVLNLAVKKKGELVTLDFNFHYDVSEPQQLAELITDKLFTENRDIALKFAKDIYKLELDEIEEE